MVDRREMITGLVGAGLAASIGGETLAQIRPRPKAVRPARLMRPAVIKTPVPFVATGEARTLPVDYDYIEEEWFASGLDDLGQPYTTQVLVRRPRNKSRFSGVLIVESLHGARVAPVYMYSSRYILRSGHGHVVVASQKLPVDEWVKPKDPTHYAPLQIAGRPGPTPPGEDRWAMRHRVNQASSAILAQVGAALRSGAGPFAGYGLRHMLLVGHSQTGLVTTNYIADAHERHRLANGRSIYDGYFPSGAPAQPFGPRDVPLIQTISEGDVPEASSPLFPDYGRRAYRRPDSDAADDRFRLYELAGIPHASAQYPPYSDPIPWSVRTPGVVKPDSVMSSFPHYEMFNVTLDHLVRWTTEGVTPPRAPLLEVAADGRFAKDEHGNSKGGVRNADMDVPRATSIPNPTNPDGSLLVGSFGFEVPFSDAKMRQLYGTPSAYMERYNARLEKLIQDRWLLGADATGMRERAMMRSF